MPRVSVIMPMYDGVRATELAEASQSILDQSFRDFEFLIWMDGVERADLIEQLNALAKADTRVRFFANQQRTGVAYALNRLVEAATGDYLARMDADDVSLPRRLQCQVEFLDEHPDVALVGTFAREVDSNGTLHFEKTLPCEPTSIGRFMASRDPFVHPTVMFRRSFFEQCGLYSEQPENAFLEDTELWSRALLAGCRVANLPEYLLNFRVTPALYGRRRGLGRVYNELRLRCRYIVKAKLPKHLLVRPLAVSMLRLSPAPITRLAYKHLR